MVQLMSNPIDELNDLIDNLNDLIEKVDSYGRYVDNLTLCQFNTIDIFQHLPQCTCIDIVSVTFQKSNGIEFNYLLCKEHIELILAIREQRGNN